MNFLHAGESTSDSSSTTKHRKKVALKQGKGLVEWIRLSNSGRLSNYGCQESVDHNELSKHCSREDCWILLFDTVFDVTKYLDFHPGLSLSFLSLQQRRIHDERYFLVDK